MVVLAILVLLATGGRSADQTSVTASRPVTCRFEKIATVDLDQKGNPRSQADSDSGELVLADLASSSPTAVGNVGTVSLQVLRRSPDAIWLAEMTTTEVSSVTTLFFRTGVVMFSKTEILQTVTGPQPFGFVEIGRCKNVS